MCQDESGFFRQGNGTVVVSGFDRNVNAGMEPFFLEEFQELPVPLVNACNHIFDPASASLSKRIPRLRRSAGLRRANPFP